MAIEEAIEKLTAAVEANTAAVLSGGGAAPAAGKAAGGKSKTPAKSKYTPEQVRDTLIKVKDEQGEDEAKRIIGDVGGYEKLAQLVADPSKFDAVMEAAEASLAAEAAGEEDSGL